MLAGLGGCIGSMLRFGIYQLFRTTHLPIATLVVNISGSFLIGVIMAIAVKYSAFNYSWKIFLATGICGGFTTFSAFSIENIQMLQEGKLFLSLAYIVASVLLGITAAWMGYRLAI